MRGCVRQANGKERKRTSFESIVPEPSSSKMAKVSTIASLFMSRKTFFKNSGSSIGSVLVIASFSGGQK